MSGRSKRCELDFILTKIEAIHGCKCTFFHLHLHETLLGVIFEFLDVSEVLLCIEAMLSHPFTEICYFGKQVFLKLVPSPFSFTHYSFFDLYWIFRHVSFGWS